MMQRTWEQADEYEANLPGPMKLEIREIKEWPKDTPGSSNGEDLTLIR